jgi:hypothetical protein
MGLSAVWLHRGWHRDRGVYERESTSTSLLAKALPVQAQSERRSLYRSVLGDLLHQGRLDRHSSLLKLEELRTSLGLSPDDHQAALEVLSVEDPLLDQLSTLELTGHTTLCSARRIRLSGSGSRRSRPFWQPGSSSSAPFGPCR